MFFSLHLTTYTLYLKQTYIYTATFNNNHHGLSSFKFMIGTFAAVRLILFHHFLSYWKLSLVCINL